MGRANMDSLIAIGVGSAYGYSLPSLLRGKGHLYFEAAAGPDKSFFSAGQALVLLSYKLLTLR
jgi:cation transport ATPase